MDDVVKTEISIQRTNASKISEPSVPHTPAATDVVICDPRVIKEARVNKQYLRASYGRHHVEQLKQFQVLSSMGK